MNHITSDKALGDIRLELLRLSESGEDYDKALGLALECVRSSDRWLRINALRCFGYIARVYGRLDLDVVLPLLRKAQGNTIDTEAAAAAQDALDDLEIFLGESMSRTSS